jgi:hypothetical protein
MGGERRDDPIGPDCKVGYGFSRIWQPVGIPLLLVVPFSSCNCLGNANMAHESVRGKGWSPCTN